MISFTGDIDRVKSMGYSNRVRGFFGKFIDKLLSIVYNKCKKYAITGVRYGRSNNE